MTPFYQDHLLTVYQSDVMDGLRELPDCSVHCCVTSPPYWGLRDYGVAGQIGLEKTPEEYVAKMVAVFREVKRVLRDDGTLWLNLGDSYWGGKGQSNYAFQDRRESDTIQQDYHNIAGMGETRPQDGKHPEIKPKDLVGIPWLVAFALRADGWYLRSDIIWCLSGGTWLYVKTDTSGECLMTVKDLYRLKPEWVRLWNGKSWTQLKGMSKSKRRGDEIELVLRSGERISCTPTHKFPTHRGLLEASEIKIGDSLVRCHLPQPSFPRDCAIDLDAAWFAGLYIAEGSMAGDCIQIAGHSKEERRWKRVKSIAESFGGSATRTMDGNSMSIRVYSKVLLAILDELTCGKTAHDKSFSPSVWRYSNAFVEAMLRGYLTGDGHHDEKNNRWRLGFCRNYNLERDLRAACARLGFHLVLNLSTVKYNGRNVPTFRGEIRESRSGHWNQKQPEEVVEIRKARCREVYDLGVADEPHVFSLASGILSHNSKPNPMPESVTDRPTKAHEYIFMLSKQSRYFYDAEAVKEQASYEVIANGKLGKKGCADRNDAPAIAVSHTQFNPEATRNKRTVWTVPSQPYPESHFATFPEDLIKPCILAGTSAKGCCPQCGAPWERVVERGDVYGRTENDGNGYVLPKAISAFGDQSIKGRSDGWKPNHKVETSTVGWQPGCDCGDMTNTGEQVMKEAYKPVPCTVLDPFGGSFTTAQVSLELGRKALIIELNPKYVAIGMERTRVTPSLPLA